MSKGRPTSWAVGMPFTIVIVLLVAAFAWAASRATTYSEQLGSAQHDLTTQQQSLDSAQKRLTQDEEDLAVLKNPGVGLVVLRSAQPAADTDQGNDAAPAVAQPWASATWGEFGGKAFLTLRAYHLQAPPQGNAYQVWYDAGAAQPILLGVLDPSPAGTASVMGKELPALAQGKRVFVTLGRDDSKTPPAGAPIIEAKLVAPKTLEAVPAAKAAEPAATEPAAKAPAAPADAAKAN